MSFKHKLRFAISCILFLFAFYGSTELFAQRADTAQSSAQNKEQSDGPYAQNKGVNSNTQSLIPNAPEGTQNAGVNADTQTELTQTHARRTRNANAVTSDELYQTLSDNGLNPSILVNTSLSVSFPYNVLIEIEARKTVPLSESSKQNEWQSDSSQTQKTAAVLEKIKTFVNRVTQKIFTNPARVPQNSAQKETEPTTFSNTAPLPKEKRFVIAVSQDDARFFLDELISFTHTLKQNPPPCRVTILFTALETAAIPSIKGEREATGTRSFIASLESTDVVALILKPTRARQNGNSVHIVPGIPNKVAPSWLLEQMLTASRECNISADIRGTFLSLYRIGFISREAILGEYLDNGIPSLLLECTTPHVTQSFNRVIDYFAAHDTGEWDLHYSHVRLNGKHFFTSEHVLLALLLICSFVPLLYLSLFSFFNKKLRPFHLSDLKQSWYLIPVAIGLTCVLLQAGQSITYTIYPSWQSHPFAALLLKGFIAILLLAAVSLFHRFIPFPTRGFIYGWQLLLIAYADIFIFALFDLSLTMLFCAQLVVAFLFSRAKHAYTLIPLGLLMLLPFVPFVTSLFTLPRQNIFGRFFDTTFLENLLIACLVLPAEFTWIKILVSIKVFGKNSKVNFPYFVTLMAIASILVIVFVLTGRFIPEYRFFQNQNRTTEIVESTEATIHVSHEKSTFLDRKRVDVLIQSEKPVLCIDVSVHNEESIAVYDANFPFTSLNANKTAVFLLDDYPPNPLKIEYTCETNATSCITIDAYLQDGNTILHEKTEVYP